MIENLLKCHNKRYSLGMVVLSVMMFLTTPCKAATYSLYKQGDTKAAVDTILIASSNLSHFSEISSLRGETPGTSITFQIKDNTNANAVQSLSSTVLWYVGDKSKSGTGSTNAPYGASISIATDTKSFTLTLPAMYGLYYFSVSNNAATFYFQFHMTSIACAYNSAEKKTVDDMNARLSFGLYEEEADASGVIYYTSSGLSYVPFIFNDLRDHDTGVALPTALKRYCINPSATTNMTNSVKIRDLMNSIKSANANMTPAQYKAILERLQLIAWIQELGRHLRKKGTATEIMGSADDATAANNVKTIADILGDICQFIPGDGFSAQTDLATQMVNAIRENTTTTLTQSGNETIVQAAIKERIVDYLTKSNTDVCSSEVAKAICKLGVGVLGVNLNRFADPNRFGFTIPTYNAPVEVKATT